MWYGQAGICCTNGFGETMCGSARAQVLPLAAVFSYLNFVFEVVDLLVSDVEVSWLKSLIRKVLVILLSVCILY